jgi:hypothetical protein
VLFISPPASQFVRPISSCFNSCSNIFVSKAAVTYVYVAIDACDVSEFLVLLSLLLPFLVIPASVVSAIAVIVFLLLRIAVVVGGGVFGSGVTGSGGVAVVVVLLSLSLLALYARNVVTYVLL